jgi:hypothetical protein
VEPSAPTAEPPTPDGAPDAFCPRCGAAYEPLQEYCLECGERLPVNRGLVGVLATGWQRRFRWYPGDWIWAALGLLVLAVVATALAIVLGGSGESTKTVVATTENVTLGPGAATGTVAPTLTTGPLPTAPEPTTGSRSTTPAPRPANPNALVEWPRGKSGYTVVLVSVPTAAGRAAAVARARQAKRNGLRQVGVLDSANYSSFHPGYYVVFYGVFGSASDASAGVTTAHSHGFGDAYQKQVAR